MKELRIEELIPELKNWNDKIKSWNTWLAYIADFSHAVAYSQIFWPRFREYRGCIFLDYKFTVAVFDQWNCALKNDLLEIEKLLNHEHILHVFNNPDIKATDKQLDFIGDLLEEMWSSKLKKDFPGKTFIFQNKKGDENNLIEYEITFWQKRP